MKTAVGIIAVLILLAGGVYLLSVNNVVPQNSELPEVALTTAAGEETTIQDIHNNEVLVINSWATWCPFCVDELPDMVRLQEEFGDQIKVIAVNRRESVSESENYLSDLGVKSGITYLYDPTDAWYRAIGGFSMPETLFVAQDGTIVIHKRGFMELDEMRDHVNAVLGS